MASCYDEKSLFIGEFVENLTNGPTNECNPNKIPFGKIGAIFPSTNLDPFQKEIADSRPYYGVRTVWHHEHGTVEQVLVEDILGEDLVWINMMIKKTYRKEFTLRG